MEHPDQALRAILLVAVLVILPVGIYHRARSQATREPLDRRQEGAIMLATLRPLGAVYWLGLIAWLIDPRLMAWSSLPLPAWLRWAAIGVLALAVVLLVWTLRTLGRNLTDTVVTRRQHTLVVSGPYRWIRHPFYDTAALLTAAIALIAANWFLLATGAAIFVLLAVRSRIEEENLTARFGDEYRRYREQTGRFMPRLPAVLGGRRL